eukprot:COSAG01_NODE_39621_length_474_cov_0.909333_1_plen_23_part_01
MAEQPEPEPGEAGKATFELEHAI